MVDYLRIKESIEKDEVIMTSIKEVYTDTDYLSLFRALDRNMKCVLISIRIITDGIEKVVNRIDSNDGIPVSKKVKATLKIQVY